MVTLYNIEITKSPNGLLEMSYKQAEIQCPPMANSHPQLYLCIGTKQSGAMKQTMGEEEAG